MTDLEAVIYRPIITEKGHRLQEAYNQYIFEVSPKANKIEILRAVEGKFNVKVKSVRTIKVRGKVKRMGRFTGRRADRKKALVTLMPGFKIEWTKEA